MSESRSEHQILYYAGMPILRLDVCSESEAILTCIVMESLSLVQEWDVDFLAGDGIYRVLLSHHELLTELILNRDPGVLYRFMVTSLSPFTSTMTTNTPADLSGARVSCSNRSRYPLSSAVMTTLALPGKNTNLN